jgi:hypothetical protein
MRRRSFDDTSVSSVDFEHSDFAASDRGDSYDERQSEDSRLTVQELYQRLESLKSLHDESYR